MRLCYELDLERPAVELIKDQVILLYILKILLLLLLLAVVVQYEQWVCYAWALLELIDLKYMCCSSKDVCDIYVRLQITWFLF